MPQQRKVMKLWQNRSVKKKKDLAPHLTPPYSTLLQALANQRSAFLTLLHLTPPYFFIFFPHFFFFVQFIGITISMLLQKVCPYCDEDGIFARMENVRRHIHRKHEILLSSRSKSCQSPKGSKPFTSLVHEAQDGGSLDFTKTELRNPFVIHTIRKQVL